MTYPNYIVDLRQGDYKIQAWPHGLHQHGPNKGTWGWCVELTRPGDSKPASVAGRNRPGWPELRHADTAWDAAEQVLAWAREHNMAELLPVPPGLRLVQRLGEHMEAAAGTPAG